MAPVWFIRGGSRDRLVARFLRDGVIGLDRDLPDGSSLDRAATLRHLGGETPTTMAEAAGFLSFVRRIQRTDIVAMPDPAADGLVFGVVAGPYRYEAELPERDARHRRSVEWRRRLPRADLPERLADLLDRRAGVDDVADGRLRTLAIACCDGELGLDPFDRPAVPTAARRSGSTARPRAPKRPPKATLAARRCTSCLVTKSTEAFDGDEDRCRDCS